MHNLTHGSLFSGIGGFELGAQMSGITTLWNCEIESYQRKILKKHFPQTKQYEDIRRLKDAEYVDIISGGFPCQDISIVNRKAKGINGNRSGLWAEMFRVLSEGRSKYIIIENTPALLKRGFEYILQDLYKIGYDAEWQVLSGAKFGYLHQRKRLLVIAYSNSIGKSGLFKNLKTCKARQRRADSEKALKDYIEQEDFEERCESKIKPLLSGKTYGLPNWVDRVKSIGNAVIPEIACYLFECIKSFEEELNKERK
jgi:DNA (cytosine-5)-methyltransferase 1